jgi:hypothetical protein
MPRSTIRQSIGRTIDALTRLNSFLALGDHLPDPASAEAFARQAALLCQMCETIAAKKPIVQPAPAKPAATKPTESAPGPAPTGGHTPPAPAKPAVPQGGKPPGGKS